MGDAVSLQPLVEGLQRAGVPVTVCIRAAWRDLLPPGTDWLDCQVPWSSYGDGEKYRPGSLLGEPFRRLVRDLRSRAAGGIGIDTRGDARNMLLLSLAGCRRIISLDRYLACDLANLPWAAELLPYDDTLRRWQLNATFLGAVAGPSDLTVERPRLRGRFLPALPTGGSSAVGLVPLAPWAGKLWPKEHWAELVVRLRAAGLDPVALYGPDQEEELAVQLGATGVTRRWCASIREWSEALAPLRALVSVDTGPMHLADALDVPLVALYGAGCLPLWAPSGPRSLALHRQNDPDYQPVHPTDLGIARGMELMARHSVADVLAALDAVTGPVPPA
jgi:ADP-heptose:LPS heptosyltransferase